MSPQKKKSQKYVDLFLFFSHDLEIRYFKLKLGAEKNETVSFKYFSLIWKTTFLKQKALRFGPLFFKLLPHPFLRSNRQKSTRRTDRSFSFGFVFTKFTVQTLVRNFYGGKLHFKCVVWLRNFILFSSSQKSLNLKNNLSFRRLKRKSDKTNLLGKTNISSQPKRNFLLGQYTPKGKPFPQNKSKTSLHVPYNETN